MKAPDRERAALKESLARMGPRQKIAYFLSYYAIHSVLLVLALVAAGSFAWHLASRKETVVAMALTNAAIGSDLESALREGFLAAEGLDPQKKEVELLKELYISNDPASENHEYAYASGLKLMAAINAKKLDLLLMNQESYDIISGSGYLIDLKGLIEGELSCAKLIPCLAENQVILSDNSLEVALGEAEEASSVTESAFNAIKVSDLPIFKEAGFPSDLYLGVVANSTRIPAVLSYLAYLAG